MSTTGSFSATEQQAWERVLAAHWAPHALPGVTPGDDPAVRAAAQFCAENPVPRSHQTLTILLARVLRDTGRAPEALRLIAGTSRRRIRLNARPGRTAHTLNLDRLAQDAGGDHELVIYRALRTAVEDAVQTLEDGGDPLALSGAPRLARRIEGPRAPNRKIRARCEDLRRFCADVAARARRGEPTEVLHVTPIH